MAQPSRTASQDSTADGIRKRVCKACDRCRLKKSKCDGSSPCSRCQADNAICVFGERKKAHDKVYPKGYVEMLEQQQAQLVSGLQEMYRRLREADAWKTPLTESNGHPLTHDILEALGLLEKNSAGEVEHFEEDCQELQNRLVANGAGFTQRRGSFSSESEHSQHGHARSMSHGTPQLSKPQTFKQESIFYSAPSSPPRDSPAPAPQHRQSHPAPQASPLQHSSPFSSEPQFPSDTVLYQADWNYARSSKAMRSNYAMETPELASNYAMGNMNAFNQWDPAVGTFDGDISALGPGYAASIGNVWPQSELFADTMDIDFAKYISVGAT